MLWRKPENLLLCSHSPNDVPPEPQRNVSIAAVRGPVHPSSPREPKDTTDIRYATTTLPPVDICNLTKPTVETSKKHSHLTYFGIMGMCGEAMLKQSI